MWHPSAQLKPGGCNCAALLSCSPGALIMMTLGECTRLEKEILQVSTRLADTNGQESEYSSRLRLQLCVVIRPLAGNNELPNGNQLFPIKYALKTHQ